MPNHAPLRHVLIVGQTQTGKSLTAKRIAGALTSSGIQVLVYDPTSLTAGPNLHGWSAAWVDNDFERFAGQPAGIFWRSSGCLVVIDEASEACDRHAFEIRAMMLRGRHLQHALCVVGQRAMRIDKTVREQCNELYAFNLGPKDAAELAEDWNCETLATCYELKPLEYIHLIRHGAPTGGVVQLPR